MQQPHKLTNLIRKISQYLGGITLDKFVGYLVKIISEANVEYTDLQLKKIEYGLTCIINELLKTIPYFIIFYFLSLQWYFITTFIFFCTIRLFTGGYHAKTFWRCFFMSLVILTTIILIGKYAVLNKTFIILILLSSFIFVCINAPVDNINKRIKSRERRSKLKIASIVVTMVLCAMCYFIPSKYLTTAVISIFGAVIMMLIGKVNNRLLDL